MTPEQIEKLYLAASQCKIGDIVSEWQENAALRKRIEKLEKVVVTSKALNECFIGGNVGFDLLKDWRAALAELEK